MNERKKRGKERKRKRKNILALFLYWYVHVRITKASEGEDALRLRAPRRPEVAARPSSSEQEKSLSIFKILKRPTFQNSKFQNVIRHVAQGRQK